MPDPLTKRCLGCGYILERLPEHRCPECGRSFDPCDPTTYLNERESGRFYLVVALLAACATALTWVHTLLVVTDVGPLPRLLRVFAVGLALGSAVVSLYVLVYGVLALRRPPGTVTNRRLLIVAFMVACLTLWLLGTLSGFGRTSAGWDFSCGPVHYHW